MSSHEDERRTIGRDGPPAEARSADAAPPEAPSSAQMSAEALSPEEGRFVERLAEGYAPEPMTPGRRVAFDEGVRARIDGRPSPWHPASWQPKAALWIPAAAAAALAAVWLFSIDPQPGSAPSTTPSTSVAAWEWEEALLAPDLAADLAAELETAEAEGEVLPEEYLAIASAFL